MLFRSIIEKMLEGIEVKLNIDFLDNKDELEKQANKIIYTGEIDRFYDYCFGHLSYRTLRFETDRLEEENHQGNAVINYTEREVPYTRVIEHKFFNYRESPVTYVTREYPKEFKPGDDPFYPINNKENLDLYAKYQEKALADKKLIFAGRLGQYKYFDMDDTIKAAKDLFAKLKA